MYGFRLLGLRVSRVALALAIYIVISSLFMRQVLNLLERNLGDTGISIGLWLLLGTGGLLCLFSLLRSSPTFLRTLLWLGIVATGTLYASDMKIIEERLHLVKFGLLGWLVVRDNIDSHKDLLGPILSLLFCLLVAGIDEVFQWWLPHRVGDMRDILFAGVGATLGISLFLTSLNPKSD